jgi:hypothetical protein
MTTSNIRCSLLRLFLCATLACCREGGLRWIYTGTQVQSGLARSSGREVPLAAYVFEAGVQAIL